MTTRDAISTCPVCSDELRVTRLHCDTCGTTIEGEFGVGRFSRLSREEMLILEGFLRARGNLRELEREMRVSYPTVKNRVETVLRALGLADADTEPSDDADTDAQPSQPAPASPSRREVLERLARHEISAEEAAAQLRGDES